MWLPTWLAYASLRLLLSWWFCRMDPIILGWVSKSTTVTAWAAICALGGMGQWA